MTTRQPRGGFASIPLAARWLAAAPALIALLVVLAVALRSRGATAALEAAVAAEGASGGASSARARAPVPEEEDRAPPEELAAARQRGEAGLEDLARRYPKDPAVLRALLLEHAAQPRGQSGALSAARRLLEIAPGAAGDEDLRRVVISAAGGPPDVASQAFDLMAGPMGSDGLDLLYDLALKSPALKERAMRLLGGPNALQRATPALRVAYELRAASSCDARKALLARAAEDGDRRAVEVLTPLTVAKSRGCGVFGLGRCPAPCAAIAANIKKAIQAIEARGTPSPAPSRTAPGP